MSFAASYSPHKMQVSFATSYSPHNQDIDREVQTQLMAVLSFMRLVNNYYGIHHFKERPTEPGWLIGRGEVNSNCDLIMREIFGAARCSCNQCIAWDARAISDAELAFAGFREYVESCAPAAATPDQHYYDIALFYLQPLFKAHPPVKGR